MEETPLFHYIRQQPELLRELLRRRESLAAPFAALWEARKPNRLVLLGSGSSYHAALMARPLLERTLGTEVVCLLPSESEGLHWCGPQSLILAISQSGLSTNVYELVRNLRARELPVLAVTQSADTPVAQAAGGAVVLPVADEAIGAKTKGVTATVLTLMLLGLSVCQDPALTREINAGLDQICLNLEENLRRAEAWSIAMTPKLLPFRHLSVLGCGSALGAAREGALKLLETNHLPVSWYPLDEYLHGVQNALDETACLLCLAPAAGKDREQTLRLAGFAQSVGACCAVISAGGEDGATLALRTAGLEFLSALEFLPALQILAATLSAARGIDTVHPRYPSFYTVMGSKLTGPV